MARLTKLGELLLHWEDAKKQGQPVSVDELCRSSPELKAEIRQRIDALEAMDKVLQPTQAPSSPAVPVVRGNANRTRYDLVHPGFELIPGYRFVEKIGKGGFGEVWKATAPGGFAVALKLIVLSRKASAEELRSLNILKELRHPNLLTPFGAWQAKGFLIIGMDLADCNLKECLERAVATGASGIPRADLLVYLQQAALGLDFLNQPNHLVNGQRVAIQHRDIKPQNLLLVGGGVRIADLGLARVLEQTLASHSGSLTLAYAAPEYFNGITSRHSDQYSLGVTYCQLRGGRLPFTGTAGQIMNGHLLQPPDLTMIPEEERPAVQRALAKETEERWSTCQEFIAELSNAHRHRVQSSSNKQFELELTYTPADSFDVLPSTGIVVGKATLRPHSKRKRRLWLYMAFSLALVLLGFFLGVNWKAKNESQGQPHPGSSPARSPKGITNSIGMQFVRIPAGKFMMGSPNEEKDRGADEHQHEVEITRDFYLGKYEVTQEQYEKVMGNNPSRFSSTGSSKDKVIGQDTRSFPVETVTWHNAVEFCKKLNELPEELAARPMYRLPTEAEWEYSCRGKATSYRVFGFGNSLSSHQANFDGDHPYGGALKGPHLNRTTTIGSYKPNRFGLYDMHGNAWEWCADWYDTNYYKRSPRKDPAGPKIGKFRVLRGGAWLYNGGVCRSADRNFDYPALRHYDGGFRVICVPREIR